ncbi:MAG: hypothetical protein AAF824_01745 [Bacteroidota bacterium]
MNLSKKQQLAKLFLETGKAHHQAFQETGGEDPEWPIWYAEYLQEKLSDLLPSSLSRSKLIYELVRLEEEGLPTGMDWTQVYARKLLDKYDSE